MRIEDEKAVWLVTDEELKKARERNHRYREKNREKERARGRKYRAENPDKFRQWREANPDKLREYYTRWYSANRDKVLAARLRREYGLDPKEYDKLCTQQRGLCAICLQKPNRALFVDHDHRNGQVRGLLCNTCNSRLGVLEKLIETGLGPPMIAYLKRNGSL